MNKIQSVFKNCCDILETDGSAATAAHRVETIAWLLCLKYFDDKEVERRTLSSLHREEYEHHLPEAFRWYVWAGPKNGRTGSELSKFINEELVPYLRSISDYSGADQHAILGAVFKQVRHCGVSGYKLREVVDEINSLDFTLAEVSLDVSRAFEQLLATIEVQKTEALTPRVLIRALIALVDPKIGESVYDPACGTGGFIAQTRRYLEPKAYSPKLCSVLNLNTFSGIEKSSARYLLCLVNLILHGLESPRVSNENALQHDIRTFDERDKQDVILTNLPFNGKEQSLVRKNFPIESNATEVLFLQHVEKKLHKNGRAAVVVPEGLLCESDNAYLTVRRNILIHCNLHTVVSLPPGVFLPYSEVKTSVIFFDKTKQTKDVWFYEVPLLDGKKLTKKAAITEKHFEELLQLFSKRTDTPQSWLIPVEKIIESGYNLSAGHYNPHGPEEEVLLEPEAYALQIQALLAEAMTNSNALLEELNGGKDNSAN